MTASRNVWHMAQLLCSLRSRHMAAVRKLLWISASCYRQLVGLIGGLQSCHATPATGSAASRASNSSSAHQSLYYRQNCVGYGRNWDGYGRNSNASSCHSRAAVVMHTAQPHLHAMLLPVHPNWHVVYISNATSCPFKWHALMQRQWLTSDAPAENTALPRASVLADPGRHAGTCSNSSPCDSRTALARSCSPCVGHC
jgi:hypothetical protein